MNQQRVISREYKLVLKTKNFTGTESDIKKKAKIFWTSFKKTIRPVIKTTEGSFNTIRPVREIRFYDTKDLTLRSNDYIFRERKTPSNNKRETTLKFRHPDRYVSQDRDMQSSNNGKTETKFEEDIKSPFLKLYSFSTSCSVTEAEKFKRLKHIAKLYPGLSNELDKYSEDKKIFVVHDPVIQEIVITGATITVCNDPLINAECALIVWYDSEAFKSDPIIVEFSFRYGDEKEDYNREAAQTAFDLFILIQEEMTSWIDKKGATKTGFVFEGK